MTPEGRIELGLADARRMVAETFSGWADLPLREVSTLGTDHLLFRLGTDKLIRIPATADAADDFARKAGVPAAFAGLSLEVPRVLEIAEPNAFVPHPWAVVEWIAGEDAATTPPHDWSQAAQATGRFVAGLRTLQPSGGRLSGRDNALRGAPLALLDAWMRPAIAAIAHRFDARCLSRLWEEALAAPVWPGQPVWVHGDLHGGNIIVRGGKVAAVIDFGLASLGDPACDLAPAWTFLPPDHRAAFRKCAAPDDDAWLRGRGWGLYAATIALAHHAHDDPPLAAMGERTLAAMLDSR
jgi:aminoglycoside phosphotransferase (APT) family kinase protein